MAGKNDPPAALRVDTVALNTFAKTLRDEAATVVALHSGLSDAMAALPGTRWEVACGQAKDTVDQALNRVGERLSTVADSIEHTGKVVELTDEQFRAKLTTIGLHP
ncbi:WXG100 family type VII secretion target [Nocardia sp. alder85J]|uniref:WXG100 family type VII secretion target n=1 Tax=Nocardia sp. alder85J TaxID=2862949 RepID=UPI001CD5A508|nr:WXG100 family type VII secretion target [Nocardia sp. alder85J]MCX4097844.1 WXG100 family type VII secretion target [Nocardia sp. alder85J]